MIFQRGNPLDYERWAAEPGLERWDYAHCLPYFKRMETCLAGADEWRGAMGRSCLERGPARGPLFDALFAAAPAGGWPLTDDVNGYRRRASRVRPQHPPRPAPERGARVPAPGDEADQLEVRTRAFVSRSCSSGERAVGVEVGGEVVRAREVILCGGAINSPQLLQLSGVGNAAELAALGIRVVADLPDVGENLQDTSRSTCSTRARSRLGAARA
jgi:choline dehydrogenase